MQELVRLQPSKDPRLIDLLPLGRVRRAQLRLTGGGSGVLWLKLNLVVVGGSGGEE